MSIRLVGAVAALVFVGACGSDADDGGDAAAEPTEATEEAGQPADEPADEPADRSAGGDEDAAGETTVAPADEAGDSGDDGDGAEPSDDADEAADAQATTGDSDSEWCVAARRVEDELGALADPMFDFTDPDVLEETVGRLLGNLDEAAGIAPPEIDDDVDAAIEGFRAIDEALAEVDYDFLSADLSAIEASNGLMTGAGERISAYNEDVCGIVAGPSDDDLDAGSLAGSDDGSDDGSDFDPDAGSVRDQTIAGLVGIGYTEEEATCVFEAIDFSDPSSFNEVERYQEILAGCGISPERILELLGADG